MISKVLMACAAIAPLAILACITFHRNTSKTESRKWLLGSAFLGVLAAAMTIIAIMLTLPGFEIESASDAIVCAFCRAAIPEECFKLLMLFIAAKCCERFNKVFDGVIYAVCIAMGFSAFENIFYLAGAGNSWFLTGIIRALVSVPGNYFFAIIMGVFFSLAWFDPCKRTRNAFLALALPMTAHGIFDTILMSDPAVLYGGAVAIIFFFGFSRRLRLYATSFVAHRLESRLTGGWADEQWS